MKLAFTQTNPTSPNIPLVLLHGFPLDRRVFTPVLEHLAGTHVVTLDLPGFGESHVPPLTTVEAMATAVRAFLVEHNLLPCVLGGLSMGGYVTLAYHRLFPQDLTALLLIDTKASADTEEAKENRNRMATIALEKGAPAVAAMMQPKMLAPNTQQNHPEINTHLLQIMTACPPQTIAAACHAMRDRPDFSPDLATLKIPLQVITGQHDAITPPALGRVMATAAPRGTFTQIPNAGHIATLEQPAAVGNAITAFLKNL